MGLICVAGYYLGGFARKLRLPSLIGFMILGVLLGPSLLKLFNETNLDHCSFITEMSLGFVAFGIGAELSITGLKKLGSGIISIIFCESLIAFVVVMLAVFLVTKSWPVALLFGALAPASAPAGTVAVIREYKAKGKLTKALYAVVGFDDGLAILIFGIAVALARMLLLSELGLSDGAGGIWHSLQRPLLEIGGSLLAGGVLGYLFCILIRWVDSPRNKLIMVFGFVLLATGFANYFHLSLILTNMLIGFVLINTRREAFVHKVTAPLHEVMPLIFLLFFCLAGAHLEVRQLPSLGLLGIVYIVARSLGLIGGARVGGLLGNVAPQIKKWIGLGILSQAGVAIGLSLVVKQDFAELVATPRVAAALEQFRQAHPEVSLLNYDPLYISAAMITTVTATCIFFEVVGPVLTKIALTKAGEIAPEELE